MFVMVETGRKRAPSSLGARGTFYVADGLVTNEVVLSLPQYEQRLQEARTERQTALDQAQTLLAENGRLTGELNAVRRT